MDLPAHTTHVDSERVKENCNNPAFQAQNNSKFFFYIYLTHMVPVISEPDPSHHQNTIHTINISFKSESYINT